MAACTEKSPQPGHQFGFTLLRKSLKVAIVRTTPYIWNKFHEVRKDFHRILDGLLPFGHIQRSSLKYLPIDLLRYFQQQQPSSLLEREEAFRQLGTDE